MRLLLSAFAALLLAVAPNFARAADVATIDCVAKELPAPARALFVESGRRSALGDETEVPGLDAALTPYRTALDRCTKRHKWNSKAADAANTYTISSFVLEGVLSVSAGQGVTLEVIEKALAKLTPGDRDELLNGGGGFEKLLAALADNGFELDLETDNQAALLGGVTGAVLMRDQARAEFIAS